MSTTICGGQFSAPTPIPNTNDPATGKPTLLSDAVEPVAVTKFHGWLHQAVKTIVDTINRSTAAEAPGAGFFASIPVIIPTKSAPNVLLSMDVDAIKMFSWMVLLRYSVLDPWEDLARARTTQAATKTAPPSDHQPTMLGLDSLIKDSEDILSGFFHPKLPESDPTALYFPPDEIEYVALHKFPKEGTDQPEVILSIVRVWQVTNTSGRQKYQRTYNFQLVDADQ